MLGVYSNKDSTDGMHHFRQLGNGTIGYEDQWGAGSDKDFDDYIFGIDLKLMS